MAEQKGPVGGVGQHPARDKGCRCVSMAKIIEVIQVYFGVVSPFEESDERYYELVRELVLERARLSPWESEFVGNMIYAMEVKGTIYERRLTEKQRAVILRMAARYLMAMPERAVVAGVREDEELLRAMVLE